MNPNFFENLRNYTYWQFLIDENGKVRLGYVAYFLLSSKWRNFALHSDWISIPSLNIFSSVLFIYEWMNYQFLEQYLYSLEQNFIRKIWEYFINPWEKFLYSLRHVKIKEYHISFELDLIKRNVDPYFHSNVKILKICEYSMIARFVGRNHQP